MLDNRLVCRWMNGQAKVSPKITGFYLSGEKNQMLFARHFEKSILPLFYDTGNVVTDLRELLIQDRSISEQQRQKLDKGHPCHTDREQAAYIVRLLLFGMERNFVKRDAKTKELLTAGNLSPVVADYIYENEIPKPCRFFCGREHELKCCMKSWHPRAGYSSTASPELEKASLQKPMPDSTGRNIQISSILPMAGI